MRLHEYEGADVFESMKIPVPRRDVAESVEDAARIAYADLIDWMVGSYGFDKLDAYLLLSQIGKVRLGNMVDPNYTVGASIAKRYID